MRRHTKTSLPVVGLALAALLGTAGCDLDVPDLNNPGINDLVDNPNVSSVGAAATGMLIGNRAGTSAPNAYVSQLGILGRESYNFDAADPRFIGELLQGQLQPGSPFGGNFWTAPYANIRLGNIILDAVDAVPDYSAEERSAIQGYVHTINALDLLRVIVTRDTIGAIIETNSPIDDIDDLGPVASRADVYAEITSKLDSAADELAAAGAATFPFGLSSGYADFNTPATFIAFNRAMRARVAVYLEDWQVALDALEASFLDPEASFDLGVYHTFTTGTGDAQNGLINVNIFAHPSFEADAQPNGAVFDARFTTKITRVEEGGTGGGLQSNLRFTIYGGPDASVTIIRNEELILLRAEANWGLGNLEEAIADLNIVRVGAGGLAPLPTTLSADEVEEEILYNRRYSLMFEGGHRWIDLKRHGRTEPCGAAPETTGTSNCMPLDQATNVINLRYPIPTAECDGRPDEAACNQNTQVL